MRFSRTDLHAHRFLVGWMLVLCFAPIPLGDARAVTGLPSEVTASELSPSRQTSLGLYVTAAEAYAAWAADPGAVTIIDVRTPDEFMFVGHPDMAWNVPLLMQTWKWDGEKERFEMVPNPDFVASVSKVAAESDTILLMCRSGGRSAMGVDQLAEAGFENVYSIVDGMEGDKVKDEESPDFGHRTLNGWKNSGLPWTYDVDPERMIIPALP